MKNIFLILVLSLLSFAGYSTSRGIEVMNRTDCDVYLQIQGSRQCPNCEIEFVSNLIVIPAGTVVTFPNTVTLGGTFPTSPAFVNSAVIYSGPRHCQPLERWLIGDPRCNYPRELIFWGMNKDCERRCPCMRAIWEPSECDGIARLMIMPC